MDKSLTHDYSSNFETFILEANSVQFRMPETRNSIAKSNYSICATIKFPISKNLAYHQTLWKIETIFDMFCKWFQKANLSHGKSWVSYLGLSWLHCNHASVANLKCKRHRSTILLANRCLEAKRHRAQTGNGIIQNKVTSINGLSGTLPRIKGESHVFSPPR